MRNRFNAIRNLPLFFYLIIIIPGSAYAQASKTSERNNVSEERIFLVVEQPPQFPGGSVALKKFISENMLIPRGNSKEKLSGQVFISFVVNTDGSLQDIILKKGLSQEHDKEALRIVNLMPNWKPGWQSGKQQRVHYMLPIEFN